VIPDIEPTERPADYLDRIGTVFARFGGDTQDSGNISYGVKLGDARYFVKTAGDPAHATPDLTHHERVELLHTAARLASTIEHPTLPKYHGTIESVEGPMLVYSWSDGEHLGTHHSARDDPATAFQRFRALPVPEILQALDLVYDLHGLLTRAGWVAGDFYDGALMYDFTTSRLTVMDLDSYQLGAYRNNMGRMFGSSRFMAPEEYQLGALIDQRTTLFVMGRTALVLLSDGSLDRTPFRGTDAQYAVLRRATAPAPSCRYPTYSSFHHAWLAAHT
jgi:serine/threonine-protein kinase